MRIVIISREGEPDRRYGLGRAMDRIARGLADRGHQVWYRSTADWSTRERGQYEWLKRHLPAAPALRPAFAERLVQGWHATGFALQQQASHVWLQDPWLAPGMQWRLRRAGRLMPPFRWGVSEHGLGSFVRAALLDGLAVTPRQYRWLIGREKRLLHRARWVISPSRAARQALLADLEPLHSPLQPPPHWHAPGYGAPELDTGRLSAASTDNAVPLVLAAGRMAPVKRYDLLSEALLILQEQYGLTPRLRIAGDGAAADLPAAASRLAHSPVIAPAPAIEDVLGSADVYVSCCAVESFGMANREAVAAGLPCIVVRGPANEEVLSGGAWLVEQEPARIAEALYAVLTDPATAAKWRDRASQAAAGWPAWDDVITTYEEILQHA